MYQQTVDPPRLRYVPDRRIRTSTAAAKATRIADRISNKQNLGPLGDEHTLFTALQTCAYRVARTPWRRSVSRAERRRWFARWNVIRDYLVEQNLGLVYSMITRFGGSELDWEEQRSEALLALLRAVDGFNPWRGFRFGTYACNAIMHGLIHLSIRTTNYRVRFPIEHEPWMDRPAQIDRWSELYADRLHRALDENLGGLTDREAMILGWRFPLDGGRGLTFREIGDAIGLSKERARQIQEDALSKLRTVLEADPDLR